MLKSNVKLSAIAVIFLLFSFNSISQGKGQSKYVDTIEVGAMMNTYIKINSTKVLSLDMGGDDNLIFEMDNGVIKMKAIKMNFQPTNFLVICRDTLLQYYIKYNKVPEKTIYEYDYNEIKSRNKSPIMIASNLSKDKPIVKSGFSVDPLASSKNKSSSLVPKSKRELPVIEKTEIIAAVAPVVVPPLPQPISEIKNEVVAKVPVLAVKEAVLTKKNSKRTKQLEPLNSNNISSSNPPSEVKLTIVKPTIEVLSKSKPIINAEVKKAPVIVAPKSKAVVNSVQKSKPIVQSAKAKQTVVKQKPTIETKPIVVEPVLLSNKEKQTLSFLNLLKETTNVEAESKIQGIKVKLSKIYQDDLNIYFYIAVHNSSPIDYQIDYVNFEVKSKEALFSSTGKQSIYPIFESFDKNANVIDGLDNTNLLYSIEKFALRNDEVLVFSIFEKSNSSKGRSTEIKITSSDFAKIKKLK